MFKKKFPSFKQHDFNDCGPCCLKIVSEHFGKQIGLAYLKKLFSISKQGVTLLAIAKVSESLGFRSLSLKLPFEIICEEQPFPFIAYWRQEHFVVVYKIDKKFVYISDPAYGLIKYSKEEFERSWGTKNNGVIEGVILVLEPTPNFYSDEIIDEDKSNFKFFSRYLIPHKKLLLQIILGLFGTSLLSLLLPFLTQALVDTGINEQNYDFLVIILIAQLMLFVGKTSIETIRSWVLLHLTSRINISIISDFLFKLMRLPINFFDSKHTGDILQKIQDHERIKDFLTNQSLQVLFSSLNLIIFSFILIYFSVPLYTIFFIGSVIYFAWIFTFLKKRKLIDYKRFNEQSLNRNNEIEIIHGMQEIKLNGSENQKRWDWEKTQVKLFRININTLKIEQAQSIGGEFINELKNILLTFWAASEVLKGEMTLGMMMASVQIVGQLNAPVIQLIQFIKSAQDAKISIERLGDIHNKEEEDHLLTEVDLQTISNQDIIIENLSFRYSDFQKEDSLKNISFKIPKGKCTAIVGASGSGKTTLMKMLLKFYKPNEGEILIGTTPLLSIPSSSWRSICGTVMQEGFIFSDSIYNNIALPGEVKDIKKLTQACRMANIYDFIQSLPLKFNTFIGRNGIGLSTGQKQRLVLARAIYRDSSYLFFDEATSALDSNNEKAVTDSILHLGRDKTSVLIAHRLSTVKNADQIIVLDNGRIVEVGTHQQLIDAQMHYFDLFKNQLEANSLEHSKVI